VIPEQRDVEGCHKGANTTVDQRRCAGVWSRVGLLFSAIRSSAILGAIIKQQLTVLSFPQLLFSQCLLSTTVAMSLLRCSACVPPVSRFFGFRLPSSVLASVHASFRFGFHRLSSYHVPHSSRPFPHSSRSFPMPQSFDFVFRSRPTLPFSVLTPIFTPIP
jgi:hypothetical protein